MTTRLEEIKQLKGVMTTAEGIFVAVSNEDFDWLIARVEKLEEALKFYGFEHDFTQRSDYGQRAREALRAEEDEK